MKKKKKYHEVDDSKLKTVESDEKYLYEENAVGLLVFPAGHFSQIVWRESTHLGVGLAQKDRKVSSLSFKKNHSHFLKRATRAVKITGVIKVIKIIFVNDYNISDHCGWQLLSCRKHCWQVFFLDYRETHNDMIF